MTRASTVAAVSGCAAAAGSAFLPVYAGGDLGGVVLAAAAVPTMTAVAMRGARYADVLRPLVSCAAVALVIATLLGDDGTSIAETGGGRAAELAGGVVHGWARSLDVVWPVPGARSLAAWVPAATGLAALLGVEVVVRTRRVALALVPALLVLTLSQSYVARHGGAAARLAGAFAAFALLALVSARSEHADQQLPRRTRVVRAARTIGALVAAMVLIAPAVGSAQLLQRRPYLLKEHRDVVPLTASVPNPLGQVADLLAQPDREMFRVRTMADVDRWTLAVLDSYDGEQWVPTAQFQPLGRELAPDRPELPAEARAAVFKVSHLPGPWLPTVPRTRSVEGASVRVDVPSGMLVRGGALDGVQYRLSWAEPDPSGGDLSTLGLVGDPAGTRFATEVPPPKQIVALAAELTRETGPTLRGAFAIEEYLRKGFKLVTGGSKLPTGHSFARLVAFLDPEGRQGTTEQFAAAYAVLARAAGIPARVAVGFRHPAADADGTSVVHGRDVVAWPEIHLTGAGWVALDPAPALRGATTARSKLATATHRARLAATTPAAKPPTVKPPPVLTPPADRAPERGARAFPLLGVLVATLALPTSIPATKVIRGRRRRRGAGDPGRAAVGAWLEARDHLRENGVAAARGLTAYELASRPGQALTAECRENLRTIAACVDLALWSGGFLQPEHADLAWSAVDQLKRTRRTSPLRALLARFDPRTLRPPPRGAR